MSGVGLAGAVALASLAGSGLGMFAGAGLVLLLLRRPTQLGRRWSRRPEGKPKPDGSDHRQIASDFAVHARAVQRQVSDYADQLADGDPYLRARLRAFEGELGNGGVS